MIVLDALNEPVHRRLMQLYTLTGRRSAALRQYQLCGDVLRKELSLLPEEQTDRLYQAIRLRQAFTSPTGRRRSDSSRPRLVVLPLAGITEEEAWFSEGMTDCLITALSEIGGLQVISRTSAYSFQDNSKSVRQTASELRVNYVVEGSVLRSGDEVRVSAQLIDAPADQHIWTRRFVRKFSEVMTLQGEIAQRLADQIEVRLTSGERSRLTTAREVDPQVRELCMRGEYFWRSFDSETAKKSIPCYEQAIALDPGYSPAYSGLAHIYACPRRAMVELERVDELFPTLWHTESYRAHIYIRLRQFDKVAEYLEQTIARADPPEEADFVKGPLVAVYSLCNRLQAATGLMEEVVKIREQGRMPATYMAIAHFGLGRQDEAIDWLEKAYDERDTCLLSIKKYYIYEVLGGHPRVQALMRRVGTPP